MQRILWQVKGGDGRHVDEIRVGEAGHRGLRVPVHVDPAIVVVLVGLLGELGFRVHACRGHESAMHSLVLIFVGPEIVAVRVARCSNGEFGLRF